MASLSSRLSGLPAEKQALLLKNRREEIYSAVNKIFEISKSLKEGKGDTFKAHCDRLRAFEAKFEEVNESIEFFNVTVEDEQLKLETTEVYSSFYQLVDTAVNNYLEFKKKLPSDSALPTSSLASSSQLPSVNLPIFSGKIEDWLEFNTLFISLVDSDPSLSEGKKFQYLRTSLRGEALTVISGLDFTPANYELAKKALVLRYENKRRLATLCLGKITNFKPTGNSTVDCSKALTLLENNWNALEKLSIPDLKDFLKLHISLGTIDMSTRREFERLHSSDEIPSYSDFISFMTERVRKDELLVTVSSKGRNPVRDLPDSNYFGPKKRVFNSGTSNVFAVESRPNMNNFNSKRLDIPNNKTEPTKQAFRSSNPVLKKNQASLPVQHSSRSTAKLECWNCGGPHLYSACTEPRKIFCYRCGAKGFLKSNCTVCNPENSQGTKRRGSL
jgi:Protein of unknown function (DUF1759)